MRRASAARGHRGEDDGGQGEPGRRPAHPRRDGASSHELVKRADVFVGGFRPGVAERLGSGPTTLQASTPASSMSTPPATGRRAVRPAAHLRRGGVGTRRPGGPARRHLGRPRAHQQPAAPWRPRSSSCPASAGRSTATPTPRSPSLSALLLGIYGQRRSGEAQFVATSMIGGNAMAYGDDFNAYAGKPPLPMPDAEAPRPPRPLPALRGRAGLGVRGRAAGQQDWEALAAAIARADLVADPRFATDGGPPGQRRRARRRAGRRLRHVATPPSGSRSSCPQGVGRRPGRRGDVLGVHLHRPGAARDRHGRRGRPPAVRATSCGRPRPCGSPRRRSRSRRAASTGSTPSPDPPRARLRRRADRQAQGGRGRRHPRLIDVQAGLAESATIIADPMSQTSCRGPFRTKGERSWA